MFLNAKESLHRLLGNEPFIPLLEEIRLHANLALSEPIPFLSFSLFDLFAVTGDRASYEKLYFAKRGRLNALAIAFLLYDEKPYLSGLEDVIWSICDEYTWSLPAHVSYEKQGIPAEITVDLFAAETAQALAEILTLLGPQLKPAIHKRIRKEINQRIFSPMFDDPTTKLGWESARNNWSAVCAGAIGAAALLLILDEERLAQINNRVFQALNCFLEGYGNDGGCAEGISYWEYGFGFYVYYAELLYEYTAGKIDLLDTAKVRAIAAFPSKIQFSKGLFVNFSDAAEACVLPSGLLSRVTRRTGHAYGDALQVVGFHEDPCYRWAHIIRNLLWTDIKLLDRGSGLSNPANEGSQMLEDLHWVIDRWTVGEHVYGFAAKGGHNNEPHNHNDLGHFIVHLAGQNVLCDLGAGLYTKSYFGEGRYELIHNSSAGHSVPVINGHNQSAGIHFEAKALKYTAHAAGVDLMLDLTNAYSEAANLKQFTRFFQWQINKGMRKANLIMDELYVFNGSKSSTIKECFMSSVPARVNGDGIEWLGAAGKLTLAYDQAQFQLEFEELAIQDHHGNWVVVYRTSLSTEQAEQEMGYRFIFSMDLNVNGGIGYSSFTR